MFTLLQTRIYVYIFIILIKIEDELLLLKKIFDACKNVYFLFSFSFFLFFFLVSLFRVGFFIRSLPCGSLFPSIQSGSSPSAGLQVVTQSTHLLKDCYPQLVSNPHRSEIRLPEQLDYWWILWLSSSNYGDESHTILGANIWKSSRDKMKKETSQSIEKTVSSILQMLLFYPTNLIYVPDFYLYSCNFYFEILNC